MNDGYIHYRTKYYYVMTMELSFVGGGMEFPAIVEYYATPDETVPGGLDIELVSVKPVYHNIELLPLFDEVTRSEIIEALPGE